MYEKIVKRLFDVLLAFFSLALLFPLLLLLCLLVTIFEGRPILFKQVRPGKESHLFTIYKFRTMNNKTDADGILLPDSERLNKFGRFLRRTSLDELPELLNILKGNMAFVGPRPMLVKDLVFFSPETKMRDRVRPGLTGLAQVSGRNRLSWDDKFVLDLQYCKRVSFLFDIKILFLTVFEIFKKNDVNQEGTVSSEDYGDYLLRLGKISKQDFDVKVLESQKVVSRYIRGQK